MAVNSVIYYIPLYSLGTLLTYLYFTQFFAISFNTELNYGNLNYKLKTPKTQDFSNIYFLTFSILILWISTKLPGYVFISYKLIIPFIFLLLTCWLFIISADIATVLLRGLNSFFILFSFLFSNIFLLSFLYVTNLLIFFLILELLATFYYFFFLTYYSFQTLNLVKYKHFLILYILNSFLTTVFFTLSLLYFSFSMGTISFLELTKFNNLPSYGLHLLLISVLWKLGIPGFHFFKLELYNYLPLSSIFFFSFFSLILNIFIIIFLILMLNYSLLALLGYYLSFILWILILILYKGLQGVSMSQFIAYSTLITLTTIFLFFLTL